LLGRISGQNYRAESQGIINKAEVEGRIVGLNHMAESRAESQGRIIGQNYKAVSHG